MTRNTYIKFDTAVRDHYRCNNHAIVFARLVYWATRNPEGFYKFKNKCDKHKLYKKGDSWAEELNMTRRDMDPVFKRLVQSYTSKSDYMKAEDKFQGKMFASYTNRKTNQTYYSMDPEAVDTFLGSLAVTKAPLAAKKEASSPSPALEPVDNLSGAPKVLPDPQRRAAQIVPPLAYAHQNTNTQTITSLVGTAPERSGNALGEEDKLSSQKMVEIWNSHAADKVAYYPSLATRLCKVLKDCFAGCLERFRQFCSIAASSPFLMGKAPNSKFKAFFWWVIKPETIKTIFQGGYGVKAIAEQIAMMSEQGGLEHEIRTVNDDLLKINKKIEYSRDEIVKAQEKTVAEHVSTLSEDKKDLIIKVVKTDIDEKYPVGSISEGFREMLYETQGDKALEDYVAIQLRLCKPEDIVAPQELLDEQTRLHEKKLALVKQWEAVVKKNHESAKAFEEMAAMPDEAGDQHAVITG